MAGTVKQRVILDIDNACGIPGRDVDDGLALALALADADIELVGCTTCAGNCRTWQATRNTLLMIEAAGRPDIPVARGRELPLLRDREAHFNYLEGPAGEKDLTFWQDMPPLPDPSLRPHSMKAHDFIVAMVKRYPGEITLVAEGSLTNLAIALLTAPEIAPLIKRVIHMGGAFPPAPGTPSWEDCTPDIPPEVWEKTLRFNTLFDPEASLIVFRSDVPVTVVPANVTTQVFLRPDEFDELARGKNGFLGYLHQICAPWIRWSSSQRNLPGAHLHDPLALALAADPDFCTYRTMGVNETILLGEQGLFLAEDANGPSVQVATEVRNRIFEQYFRDRLAKLETLQG